MVSSDRKMKNSLRKNKKSKNIAESLKEMQLSRNNKWEQCILLIIIQPLESKKRTNMEIVCLLSTLIKVTRGSWLLKFTWKWMTLWIICIGPKFNLTRWNTRIGELPPTPATNTLEVESWFLFILLLMINIINGISKVQILLITYRNFCAQTIMSELHNCSLAETEMVQD